MSDEAKPAREWWIKNGMAYECEPEAGSWSYHVIDMSAYVELVNKYSLLADKYAAAADKIFTLTEQSADTCAARDQWRSTDLRNKRLEKALAFAKSVVLELNPTFKADSAREEIERLERE
jgi:hypothetical protein